MGEESTRFRDRARQCRVLAEGARDLESRQSLSDMAKDLDAEAAKIDGEEEAAKRSGPQ